MPKTPAQINEEIRQNHFRERMGVVTQINSLIDNMIGIRKEHDEKIYNENLYNTRLQDDREYSEKRENDRRLQAILDAKNLRADVHNETVQNHPDIVNMRIAEQEALMLGRAETENKIVQQGIAQTQNESQERLRNAGYLLGDNNYWQRVRSNTIIRGGQRFVYVHDEKENIIREIPVTSNIIDTLGHLFDKEGNEISIYDTIELDEIFSDTGKYSQNRGFRVVRDGEPVDTELASDSEEQKKTGYWRNLWKAITGKGTASQNVGDLQDVSLADFLKTDTDLSDDEIKEVETLLEEAMSKNDVSEFNKILEAVIEVRSTNTNNLRRPQHEQYRVAVQ